MNPLVDILPEKYRKYVYAVAALAVFVLGVWQAADGDWVKAIGLAIGSLVPATAASNTAPKRTRK